MNRELVNGHPPEMTFQGGYYVAQSLTKQWQDPRLVGEEPLLSQGQPKSRRLQPGRALMGSRRPLTACSGAVGREAGMREALPQLHTGVEEGWPGCGGSQHTLTEAEGKGRQ